MKKVGFHKNLAIGRWHTYSLAEQLGNIGGEVHRARVAQGKNETRFRRAVDRALELFELTITDPRWQGRLREITRAREVFCDAVFGGVEYGTTFSELERYFDCYAVAARMRTAQLRHDAVLV